MAEEFSNKHLAIGKFIAENNDAYRCLYRRFGNEINMMNDIIYAWSLHPALAKKFSRSLNNYKVDDQAWIKQSMFVDINSAMVGLINQLKANDAFNKQQDDKIIKLQGDYTSANKFDKIKIDREIEDIKRIKLNKKSIVCAKILDLQVYLVSDYGDVGDCLSNLYHGYGDFKIEQFIANEQLQELVINYAGDKNNIANVAKIIGDKLSSSVTVKQTEPLEVVVNNIIGIREENELKFDELCDKIGKDNQTLPKELWMSRVIAAGGVKYASYNMPVPSSGYVKFHCTKNKNTINNGIVFNIVNNTTIINNYDKPKKPASYNTIAEEWIKNNPPNEREPTMDYYKRYKDNNTCVVANTVFGKIMARSKEFRQAHSGKTYYWTHS
jgi:hypothetical protein